MRPKGPVVLLLLFAQLAACGEPDSAPVEEAPSQSDLLERITRPGDGGEVHLVRLVQHGGTYAFDPAEISIASGDVIRFVMAGTQPESVAFVADGAAPEVASYIRASALDRGVLLLEAGDSYDVTFPEAPAGSYPFRSIPHAGLGMTGTVQVRAP